MTDQERKAMQMALEALKASHPISNTDRNLDKHSEALSALRQALAQGEQEPVAWIRSGDDQLSLVKVEDDGYMVWKPLYTAPPSKPFVFLTKEDMPSGDHPMYDTKEFYAGMAWAQTKLKEKNT